MIERDGMTDIANDAGNAIEKIRSGDRGKSGVSAAPLAVVGLVGAAAGALLAFVLDPQLGRTRRAVTRDRLAGGGRRLGRWTARRARFAASTADGLGRRLGIARRSDAHEPLDEVALAHKVESILFRDPRIEKGDININAEHGAVFLRGTVADRARAEEIRRRVERIDGVGAVVSLLRVPGESGAELAEDAERPIWTTTR